MIIKFDVEQLKRIHEWLSMEESAFLEHWLLSEVERLRTSASRPVGENVLKSIVDSQRNLAMAEEVKYILEFKDRLSELIKVKESSKEDLTDFQEL